MMGKASQLWALTKQGDATEAALSTGVFHCQH